MAYRFIFGDFGSGKTEYIYNYLIENSEKRPEKMFYIMVPEQNTLKAQQEIIRRHPRHGMLNIDVLSFNLLSYRVMEELGIKKPDILDEVSKSMILRDVCESVSDRLLMYGSKIKKTGFINQLKSAVSEFWQYGVSPEDLKRASEDTADNILKAKLEDISLIFGTFREEIKGRYAAAEEIPYILLKNLHKSELLDNAVIFFDGFAEYTPVQLRITEGIMEKAEDTFFSVTVSKETNPYKRETGPLRATELYYLGKETVAKITDLASGVGISKGEDIRTEYKRENDIKIFVCETQEEEADAACSYIERLVREEGLRYRDIAIASADMETRKNTLERFFNRAGIPYFTDIKETALDNVIAEFIRSAAEACAENFSEESVLRYIKNPLSGNEFLKGKRDELLPEGGGDAQISKAEGSDTLLEAAEDVRFLKDETDNYIRALGIRGKKGFKKEWTAVYKGAEGLNLKELNEFKDGLLSPLLSLAEALKGESVKEKTEAFLEFMQRTELPAKKKNLAEEFEKRGLVSEAKKLDGVLSATVGLFDRLSGLMGERKMKLSDFKAILEAGFSEMKIGRIPAKLDQVITGDLKRSRFEGVKVLIILGVNDGIIPSAVSGGGIFSDVERQFLLADELRLAPADAEESCIQKFYLKMNMKKPSSRLILSYAGKDPSGKALKPSEVIEEIKDEYREERGSEIPVFRGESFKFIKNTNEALAEFAENLIEGRSDKDLKRKLELYKFLADDPDSKKKAENILRAAFTGYGRDRISERTAKKLYGDILYGSVTRLESYRECAYRHFLRYGLNLMERQRFDLEAADIGNLYHKAIDAAFSKIEERKKKLTEISDTELSELSRECVDRVSVEYNNEIMQSSERNIYLTHRVGRITERTLFTLKNQLKRGDFEIYGCELPFKYNADGLSLMGRIDRVDRFETESKVYVKVIDYKSGKTKFDLSMIYQGMQLQLVSYMDIEVRKSEGMNPLREVVPAGIFYYNIDDPVADYEEGLGEEETERRIFKKLRMNGLVNTDPDAILHMDREACSRDGASDVLPLSVKDGKPVKRGSSTAETGDFFALFKYSEKKMKEASGEILSGNIEIKPFRKGSRTGCDYCPYHSICGFDPRLEGYGYRNLKSFSEEELWKRIKEAEAERS